MFFIPPQTILQANDKKYIITWFGRYDPSLSLGHLVHLKRIVISNVRISKTQNIFLQTENTKNQIDIFRQSQRSKICNDPSVPPKAFPYNIAQQKSLCRGETYILRNSL